MGTPQICSNWIPLVSATRRSIPSTCYLSKNGPEKNKKRSKTAKSSQKGDFARQNSPLRKCFLRLFSCPSSRPVRAGRFPPPNFDRGLKTRISSDDRRSIKNDHLQCEKLRNGPFCTLKCRPLKKILNYFFAHLLGPSELVILHPRTLIGDEKRVFPAMIAERSKMIIITVQNPVTSPL